MTKPKSENQYEYRFEIHGDRSIIEYCALNKEFKQFLVEHKDLVDLHVKEHGYFMLDTFLDELEEHDIDCNIKVSMPHCVSNMERGFNFKVYDSADNLILEARMAGDGRVRTSEGLELRSTYRRVQRHTYDKFFKICSMPDADFLYIEHERSESWECGKFTTNEEFHPVRLCFNFTNFIGLQGASGSEAILDHFGLLDGVFYAEDMLLTDEQDDDIYDYCSGLEVFYGLRNAISSMIRNNDIVDYHSISEGDENNTVGFLGFNIYKGSYRGYFEDWEKYFFSKEVAEKAVQIWAPLLGLSVTKADKSDAQPAEQAQQELVFEHDAILIIVNKSAKTTNLYDAVRYCWRVNKERAETYPYVMAVVNGVIKDVYKPIEWKEATTENFPEYTWQESDAGRYGFVGELADDEIRIKYIGKKVPDRYRKKGAATPIRYINVNGCDTDDCDEYDDGYDAD